MDSEVSADIEEDFEEVYYDDDIDYYYQCSEEVLQEDTVKNTELEFFDFECLNCDQAKHFLTCKIESLSKATNVCYVCRLLYTHV